MQLVTSMDLSPTAFSSPVFQSRTDHLVVYYETSGVPPRMEGVTWYNLSFLYPWLLTAVQRNRALANQRCVAGKVGKPTSCLDALSHIKLAAMHDGLARFGTILWLDADAQLVHAPDAHFFDWTRNFDMCTISRINYFPDTGITLLRPTPCTFEFLDDALHRIRYHPNNRNDVDYFADTGTCRVGTFAYGCSRSKHVYRSAYKPYCPSRSSNTTISPFNIQTYALHYKNGSGPIGRARTQLLVDLGVIKKPKPS